MVDTSAADDGSVESIIHDANEIAMGWYAAVTGKGVTSGPGYVQGLAAGPDLVQVQAPVSSQVLATPFFQSPLVIVAVIGLVAVLVLAVK